MSRVVVLRFEGDLKVRGFQVTLEIRSESNQIELEGRGQLPPNLALVDSLHNWQDKYRNVGAPARIKPKQIIYDGNIQQRRNDCKQAAVILRDRFTAWLKLDSFRSVDLQLREELQRDEEIRLLLRSADQRLQKLPWHEWDFVQRYPNTEVVLTPWEQKRRQSLIDSHQLTKNRILAILGHRHGIDVDVDRQLLEHLPNSEVTFLVEPLRQELGDCLWEQSWDVIFFAGHSETEGETGRIYLNPTDSLTIEELWYTLRKAVDRGLKLAIFNSCDGLGLVQQLDDLAIPHLIVMRELVPDRVAQEFLKYLLSALSASKPVHLAVREARERLEALEPEFPCATWLPVMHQSADYIPISPLKPLERQRFPIKQLLFISLVVTTLVIGIRWTGLLQSAELPAYDHLMRSRPTEQPDPRLLLVSIDEEDIRQYHHPISDDRLALALEKLIQEKPIAIGMNITRDLPVEKGYIKFANLLRNNRQLITTCSFENQSSVDQASINPPPAAPATQVGFNNSVTDRQWNNWDHVIRRQILSRSENPVSSFSKCNTGYSFNLLLAEKYLIFKGLSAQLTDNQEWQLGNVIFSRLFTHYGGYQRLDDKGYQILINYRNSKEIARSISLRDLLSNKYHSEWIEKKIVLIGLVASSIDSNQEDTPLSRLPKLHVQAQMLSSILSAIDQERPLIHCLPVWGDMLWVNCWSLVGISLVMLWRSRPLWLWIGSGIAWGILYGFCWACLMIGIWIPLIPGAIALLAAAGLTTYWGSRRSKEFS